VASRPFSAGAVRQNLSLGESRVTSARSHDIAFDNENLLVDFVGVVPPLSLYSTGTPRVESLCICFATSQQSWGQAFCAGPAFALFYQQREL